MLPTKVFYCVSRPPILQPIVILIRVLVLVLFDLSLAIVYPLEQPQPKWYIIYVDIIYHHSLKILLQPDLQNVSIAKKIYNTATARMVL